MPALSSSNRSQLSYKLEGTYPTNFGVPQGGNGVLLNMLSETFDYNVTTEASKTIQATGEVPDIVQVGAASSGGFAFEHIYRENDPFIEGVLRSAFVAYGTNGVSAAIGTLTLAADTITASVAPTGADDFTTLLKGQWIVVKPAAGASQDVKDYFAGRAFRLDPTTAPTGTVLNLDPATQIDTAKAGASLTNATIATSYVTNGSTMKSYTIEVQHADISRYRQYQGMIPSKISLKLEVGKIVTGSFDFMGKSFALLTSTSMGTPTASQTFTPANATRGVFDIFEGGASITASTFIKSAEFNLDGSLRAQDAVGVFGTAGVGTGTRQNRGKLQVYFADSVMYGKVLSGAASSLSIPILDVDGNGYVYYFPRIKYTAAKVQVAGQDQDNMLDMDWQALPDTTAGSPFLGKSIVIFRVGA